MEQNFFGFQVEIDTAATRDWYRKAEGWDCTCGHCRNFLTLAREQALPSPVLNIMDQLGIPPEKATYVCQIYPVENGDCYEFSYRIAGKILSGDENSTISQDWGDVCCFHEAYPYGAPDFPEPHFDLGFWVSLPWVLDEPEI